MQSLHQFLSHAEEVPVPDSAPTGRIFYSHFLRDAKSIKPLRSLDYAAPPANRVGYTRRSRRFQMVRLSAYLDISSVDIRHLAVHGHSADSLLIQDFVGILRVKGVAKN